MTTATVDHAKAWMHKDDKGDVVVQKKPQPAYYLLVPLTVPLDIVTFPIQAIWYLGAHHEVNEEGHSMM